MLKNSSNYAIYYKFKLHWLHISWKNIYHALHSRACLVNYGRLPKKVEQKNASFVILFHRLQGLQSETAILQLIVSGIF